MFFENGFESAGVRAVMREAAASLLPGAEEEVEKCRSSFRGKPAIRPITNDMEVSSMRILPTSAPVIDRERGFNLQTFFEYMKTRCGTFCAGKKETRRLKSLKHLLGENEKMPRKDRPALYTARWEDV